MSEELSVPNAIDEVVMTHEVLLALAYLLSVADDPPVSCHDIGELLYRLLQTQKAAVKRLGESVGVPPKI